MAGYTYRRVDTAVRLVREELQAKCPGWGTIDTNRPQFAIFAPNGRPADWPLIDTLSEAARDCAEFNRHDDDDEGINEARWQSRMAGDWEDEYWHAEHDYKAGYDAAVAGKPMARWASDAYRDGYDEGRYERQARQEDTRRARNEAARIAAYNRKVEPRRTVRPVERAVPPQLRKSR
jgi:hypothetical protein